MPSHVSEAQLPPDLASKLTHLGPCCSQGSQATPEHLHPPASAQQGRALGPGRGGASLSREPQTRFFPLRHSFPIRKMAILHRVVLRCLPHPAGSTACWSQLKHPARAAQAPPLPAVGLGVRGLTALSLCFFRYEPQMESGRWDERGLSTCSAQCPLVLRPWHGKLLSPWLPHTLSINPHRELAAPSLFGFYMRDRKSSGLTSG